MSIVTKNGWIITLVVVLSLIYFGIIIAVILSPVKDLAPLTDPIEPEVIPIDENEERGLGEGNIDSNLN